MVWIWIHIRLRRIFNQSRAYILIKAISPSNQTWIEKHIQKCDVVLPLVAIATPATYVQNPIKVFELDFEANLAVIRLCVKYR